MKKRVFSLLTTLIIVFSCLPIGTFSSYASNVTTEPTIRVESKYTSINSTVEIKVDIENNPGVAGATLSLSYDPKLELIDVESGEAFSNLTLAIPGEFTNPSNFLWDSGSETAEKDGTILKLKFRVSDEASADDNLNINLSYYPGDIYNENLDSLNFQLVNGCVNIIDYIPGDVNGDEQITGKDITLIRRFIVGGYKHTINELAADVNEDGNINGKDVVLIRRFIVGGYDVELKPSVPKCEHTMNAVAYNAATCTEDGNIAYWHCSKCNEYFSDAKGTSEITLQNTVIAATGHTVVTDPAVEPSYTSTGLTEGSHCSVCNEVFVEQEVIPAIKGYSIKYNIANGDNYLTQMALDNSSNPIEYFEDSKTIVLENLVAPDGYQFLGWFDGAGENATQVREIKKGSTGNIELFAHWNKISYTISFKSDMVPLADKTYTTDREVVLPSPMLDKYTFVGWSDENGKVLSKISAGSTGDITLYANWSSNRNKASKVSKLKDPIILEDSDKGLLLFTYEIGTIENVPLFTTLKLNCVNGIITENSKTNEKSISTEQAKTVAQTISNATTNSSSWTLEKNWNNSTQVSQSYLDQTEQTREEAETLAKSQSNTYNLSTSFGGSSLNTSTSGGSFKLSGNQAHSDSTTTESGQNFNLSVDAKYSKENSGGLSLGIPIKGLELGINAGKKSTFEIGGGVNYGNYVKNTNTGTDSWSNSAEISGQKSCSSTNEKTWNTTSGYSSSNSTSMSNSISNSISKLISKQYGYGKTYSEGGSNSKSQQFATTDSKSDEFSTTMTYYSSEIKSTTTTYSSTGNTKGDYRLVMSGEVHVFAVVGYDVTKRAYFVYTYNVLDDKTEEYLDYSYDGTFNDYETSIIPFEVPSFVNDFVNNRIAMTDGLRIDPDTGIIDKYTPSADGAATIISVPSYVSVDNGDGTYKSVKVTGISSDLFKNNTDVVGAILGHSITEIPDNAFDGCSSLKYVISPGVTEIGDNAFKNCTSLENFSIPTNITEIGSNAFENAPSITANASNSAVARAVASSSAENIVLDISAIVQEETENLEFNVGSITSFELQGKDKEYNNLRIKSDAETTVINGIMITNATRIPLELSSQNITLNRVNVNSSGYAMLLTANEANITLNGNNNFTTKSGNTVICKNINLEPLSVSVVGKMNISGKMMVCGGIKGIEYLVCDNIEYIDEETYSQYKKGMFNITLDANGGEVSDTNITAYFGTAIGVLPIPTRDYHIFLGWFTSPDEGKEVTAESTYATAEDITLYAHWHQISESEWIKASDVPEGAEITDKKWTYTLREYTTNGASSLSGWTKYDTKRTSWGNWSGWSTSNPSNGVRNVESRSVYDHTEYHYYRWTNGSGSYTYKYNSSYWLEERWFTYILPTSSYGTSLGYIGSDIGRNLWARADYSGNYSVDKTFTRSVNRTEWRYQDPIYTYYYYRDLAKEATSDPTGQANVSNVVKYVKYRPKTITPVIQDSVQYNNHTYTLYTCDLPISWDDAKVLCEENNGHLATVTSVEENNAIKTMLTSDVYAWIGGHRTEGTDTWNWITSEAFSYTDWLDGEPNNTGGTENCIGYYKNSQWNDFSINSSSINSFILETE